MADPLGVSTGNSASGTISSLSAGILVPPNDHSVILASIHSDYKLSGLVGPSGYTYIWFYQSELGQTYYTRQVTAIPTTPSWTFDADIGSATAVAASFTLPTHYGLLQYRGSANAGTAWAGDTFEQATKDWSVIVVSVGMFDPRDLTSIVGVTDNAGNTYYPATDLYRANNGPVSNSTSQLWYAYDITGRAGHNVIVTFDGVPEGGAGVGLYEFGPVGSASPSPSGSTSPSPGIVEEVRLIRRLRQSPHLSQEQLTAFIAGFTLDLETGRGLETGQGVDPQVMLQYSDDGGHTWSSEQWVSAGRLGAYAWRARWLRVGRTRDRVWRITVSDPVPWRLLDAYVGATGGMA